jgi:hypothetical protein
MRHILLLLLLALPVFPYGSVGHETIAYIAEHNVSPATLAKIKPLLGGQSIEEVAVWADVYKRSHRNTGPWHYINIPVRENVSLADLPRFYSLTARQKDANIVRQIEIDIKVLKDRNSTFQDRQQALRFMIHPRSPARSQVHDSLHG